MMRIFDAQFVVVFTPALPPLLVFPCVAFSTGWPSSHVESKLLGSCDVGGPLGE